MQAKLDGTAVSAGWNECIASKGDRDCAVWGSEHWGQDGVATTSGTMAIVFSGLSKADAASSLKDGTMAFAKRADRMQGITVNGWNAETHSVVFASGMSAFNAWASVATPTLAQAKAGRAEAWKAAGLATA